MSSHIMVISEDTKRQLEVMIREKFDATDWMFSGRYIELAEALDLDELVVEMKQDQLYD